MSIVNSGVDVVLVAEKLNSSSGEQETDTAINLPHVLIHTHTQSHIGTTYALLSLSTCHMHGY